MAGRNLELSVGKRATKQKISEEQRLFPLNGGPGSQ